jgi:benzylsuccinate CoA-transferase BbsF subunit
LESDLLDHAAPCGCYPCNGADRWCAIAVIDDGQWRQLCHAMGEPQLARDDRFTTLERRRQNRAGLDKRIAAWTTDKPAEEIVHRLQKAGVPSAAVADARDLACDPHLMSRNYFLNLPHPLLGSTTADRSPIRFMEEEEKTHRSAPLLGEHNEYVYKEVIGLSDEAYETYRRQGIIY